MRYLLIALMSATLSTGCARVMTAGADGGAGCSAYAEARLTLPYDALDRGPLSEWVAGDLDARMTATCR